MNDYTTRVSRFEFKRDELNGMLIGPDGCHYDTEAEAMFYSLRCGCGCGRPEDIYKFVIQCLVQFVRPASKHKSMPGVDGIETLVQENPGIAAEFIGHVLNGEELLEHGGGVFGSWLTERGKQFVALGVHRGED